MRQIDETAIDGIRDRLRAVADGLPAWVFNPSYEMFMGSTNAVELDDRFLDLGRTKKEWAAVDDGVVKGYRLTQECQRYNAHTKALGEFLANCREDMQLLLDLLEVRK